MLIECNTGVCINKEKFSPSSLGDWIKTKSKRNIDNDSQLTEAEREAKADAIQDTRLDGTNPTPLVTKTLGQMSAIATENFDILDDEDLEARLKQLEWLLLANIPEQEVRPDTRASFAAGKITQIVPALLLGTDDLVGHMRELANLEANAPKSEKPGEGKLRKHNAQIHKIKKDIKNLRKTQDKEIEQRLRRCFGWLVRAFR